jgi:hypothetical protein
MNSKVISRAGGTIEVYSDDDWCKMTGTAPHALMWTQSRESLLRTLWNEGTFVDEKTGRASRKLLDVAVAKYGFKAKTITGVLALLNSTTFEPAVERKINGKRTYRVELVALPQYWFDNLTKPVEVVEPEPVEIQPAPPVVDVEAHQPAELDVDDRRLSVVDPGPPPVDVEPSMEFQVTEAVAHALLTQVIEIITAGPTVIADTQRVTTLEADIRQAQARLSQRLEENDKLRRVVRELQDQLAAAHNERDGLRHRLKAAEYNLEKAMSGDAQRIIQGEVMKELDKVMRAAPGSSKGAA